MRLPVVLLVLLPAALEALRRAVVAQVRRHLAAEAHGALHGGGLLRMQAAHRPTAPGDGAAVPARPQLPCALPGALLRDVIRGYGGLRVLLDEDIGLECHVTYGGLACRQLQVYELVHAVASYCCRKHPGPLPPTHAWGWNCRATDLFPDLRLEQGQTRRDARVQTRGPVKRGVECSKGDTCVELVPTRTTIRVPARALCQGGPQNRTNSAVTTVVLRSICCRGARRFICTPDLLDTMSRSRLLQCLARSILQPANPWLEQLGCCRQAAVPLLHQQMHWSNQQCPWQQQWQHSASTAAAAAAASRAPSHYTRLMDLTPVPGAARDVSTSSSSSSGCAPCIRPAAVHHQTPHLCMSFGFVTTWLHHQCSHCQAVTLCPAAAACPCRPSAGAEATAAGVAPTAGAASRGRNPEKVQPLPLPLSSSLLPAHTCTLQQQQGQSHPAAHTGLVSQQMTSQHHTATTHENAGAVHAH
jgi:hypothetical protein